MRCFWRIMLLVGFLLLLGCAPLEAKKTGKKKKRKPKEGGPAVTIKPMVSTTVHKGKTFVAPKCAVCETTTLHAHKALKAAQNSSLEAAQNASLEAPPSGAGHWKVQLEALCGAQEGCKDFLTKASLSALATELADLQDDPGSTPDIHTLQELFCFEV